MRAENWGKSSEISPFYGNKNNGLLALMACLEAMKFYETSSAQRYCPKMCILLQATAEIYNFLSIKVLCEHKPVQKKWISKHFVTFYACVN